MRVLPDAESLSALAAADPLLGDAMRRLPPFPGYPGPARRMTHFHSLARSIVYQQLAGAAARTIYERVRALGGTSGFPKPDHFLDYDDDTLRGAGLSRSKTRAIRDLATRVCEGSLKLSTLGRATDREVVERLTCVWGVGEWTAQMFLIFKLGRLDVLPTGDLGVQEGARRLYGLDNRPTPAELGTLGERWRPLRSVASWYLWRASEES